MIKAAQHVCICVVIVGGLVYAPTSRALINEENPGVAVAKGLFDVVVTLWGAARAAVEHVIDCAQFPGACKHMVDPEHAQSVNQFLVPFLAKKRVRTWAQPITACLNLGRTLLRACNRPYCSR
jgi:hypothetical protein